MTLLLYFCDLDVPEGQLILSYNNQLKIMDENLVKTYTIFGIVQQT